MTGRNFLVLRAKSWYTDNMPSLYIHTLFGFAVRDRLQGPAGAAIRRHGAAFLAGLPGPDIYFYDRFPPPLLRPHQKRTGNALHDAPAAEVFAALIAAARGNGSLSAHALGFLCHYALDAAAHPFVEASHRGLDHTRFEMQLELPFCARMGSDLPSVPPDRLYAPPLAERGLLDALDALQRDLAQAVAGAGRPGVYARSFRNFRRTYALLYDPAARKQRLLRRFERLAGRRDGTLSGFLIAPAAAAGNDLFNEAHAPWAAPWAPGVVRTESFFDLYGQALGEALALAPLLADALAGGDDAPLLERLQGGSMAHGKPV